MISSILKMLSSSKWQDNLLPGLSKLDNLQISKIISMSLFKKLNFSSLKINNKIQRIIKIKN